MLDNGKTINNKVMESIFGLTNQEPIKFSETDMKVIGSMVNVKDLAVFIMPMEQNTKDNGWSIVKMEMPFLQKKMERFSKACLRMIGFLKKQT